MPEVRRGSRAYDGLNRFVGNTEKTRKGSRTETRSDTNGNSCKRALFVRGRSFYGSRRSAGPVVCIEKNVAGDADFPKKSSCSIPEFSSPKSQMLAAAPPPDTLRLKPPNVGMEHGGRNTPRGVGSWFGLFFAERGRKASWYAFPREAWERGGQGGAGTAERKTKPTPRFGMVFIHPGSRLSVKENELARRGDPVFGAQLQRLVREPARGEKRRDQPLVRMQRGECFHLFQKILDRRRTDRGLGPS